MKKSEAYWEGQAKKIKEKLQVGKPFTEEDTMPFGKFKGRPLKEVPEDYLIWVYTESDIAEKVRLFKYIDQDLPLLLGLANENRKNKNSKDELG